MLTHKLHISACKDMHILSACLVRKCESLFKADFEQGKVNQGGFIPHSSNQSFSFGIKANTVDTEYIYMRC